METCDFSLFVGGIKLVPLPKKWGAINKEKGDLKTCSLLEMVSIVKFVIEILENTLTKL